jgi:hypothetical protein
MVLFLAAAAAQAVALSRGAAECALACGSCGEEPGGGGGAAAAAEAAADTAARMRSELRRFGGGGGISADDASDMERRIATRGRAKR